MKAILLSAIAASMALSAAAAPKRLASILEVEPDMDLSDPISVAMYTSFFLYDDQGRLIHIHQGNDNTNISYDDLASGKLKLIYESSSYGKYEVYEVTLDDEGRAVTVTHSSDNESKDYTFGYTDGYLSSIVETSVEDGCTSVNTTEIAYSNGSVSSMTYSETGDPTEDYTCDFTYDNVANVGSLRLFDALYGIDLSELEYLAQAGYMGLAPKELPTAMTLTTVDGSQSAKVAWACDAEGFPTRLSVENSEDEYTEFSWESDPAGLENISDDNQGDAQYYNLHGMRIDGPQNGIYIVKYFDGRSKKIIAH